MCLKFEYTTQYLKISEPLHSIVVGLCKQVTVTINGLRKTNNLVEVENYHSRTEKKTKQSRKIVIVFNQKRRDAYCTFCQC